MKVTRTLQADAPPELAPICRAMGYLRGDIWRRYVVSHTANQFIVRSDKHSSVIVDGRLVITIRIAKQPIG